MSGSKYGQHVIVGMSSMIWLGFSAKRPYRSETVQSKWLENQWLYRQHDIQDHPSTSHLKGHVGAGGSLMSHR